MRTRNAYSNTNANLFFALLTYFFIKSHSFVKFKFVDFFEKYIMLNKKTQEQGQQFILLSL